MFFVIFFVLVPAGALRYTVNSHTLIATNTSEATAALQQKHDSGAIVLTILSLVGLYLGLAARTLDAKAIMARESALDRAGVVMRDVSKSFIMFSDFYNALKTDLEQMPAQWNERHNSAETIDIVKHTLPFPEIHEEGINPIQGTDVDKIFWDETVSQAKNLMWTIVGLSSSAAGTATSIFGFVMSLRSLSKTILSHLFTSEDERYIAQTKMFRMMLRAQEANAYMQFCSFVKVTWEEAMVEESRQKNEMGVQWNDFNQEKARHVAGEMQRMWRCHCLSKVDHRRYDEFYTHDDAITLHLVFDPTQGYALFSPQDTKGVRLLVNRFSKQKNPTQKFITDIQVVYRKCTSQTSMCTGRGKKPDTSYEKNLLSQGYKMLVPRLASASLGAIKAKTAEIRKKRNKHCLAVAKDGDAQMADIQQLSGSSAHSIVLIYIKENEGENDIPINDLMVVYGRYAAEVAVDTGWTLLPLPLYQDTSQLRSRLHARKEQPFIVFMRSHAIVPCPRVPPEMEKAHDCCEVPKPSANAVSTLGHGWCTYHPWLRKDPSRIAGYEAAIHYVFEDGSEEIRHPAVTQYCFDNDLRNPTSRDPQTGKSMWLEGCKDGMQQIDTWCEMVGNRYWIKKGALTNSYCTGRSFLLGGDPMWIDPGKHEKGRKGGIMENFVLAANVYGSAGVGPTCKD